MEDRRQVIAQRDCRGEEPALRQRRFLTPVLCADFASAASIGRVRPIGVRDTTDEEFGRLPSDYLLSVVICVMPTAAARNGGRRFGPKGGKPC